MPPPYISDAERARIREAVTNPDHSGWGIDPRTGRVPIGWLTDARGLSYSTEPDGSRRYNAPSPFVAHQSEAERALGPRPNDSFFKDAVWDDKTGTWKKKTNWNNILALAAGGMVGAGAISGAVGAAGASGAGGAAATHGAVDLAAAPALGSTAPGVMAGTTLADVAAGGGGMSISGPLATLIGQGVQAGTGAYGSRVAAGANRDASALQAKGIADQLAFQREIEATRQKEVADQKAAAQAAWDAEQARRAPFRESAQNAMIKLAHMTGLPAPTTGIAPPSAVPPPGWSPGMPVSGGGGGATVPMSALMPQQSGTDALVASAMQDPRRIALGLEGRASGGPVNDAQSYIVGENGPEVFTPKSSGQITPNNFLATGTGNSVVPPGGSTTPALGQPSMNAGDVNAAYQQAFGRAPDARELASELENANKYGKAGILDQIARRTSNDPHTGDYGVADWSKIGAPVSSSGSGQGSGGGLDDGIRTAGPTNVALTAPPDPTLPIGTPLPPPMAIAGNPAGVAPGPFDQVWWRKYRDQAGNTGA